MAKEICYGAWHRAERLRNHRLQIYATEHMPTNTHREFADKAAEHRARRRWIERERATNPNIPQEDDGTQSTTTATSTPHIYSANDIMMDSDTSG
eukprot:2289082-Pyramimonas_sp.AAC.1